VVGHVDGGNDVLREHAAQRIADRDALGLRDWRKAGAHRIARLVDVQRVRVVAIQAAHRLQDAAHAPSSSARVLMLRKASASSSNCTSTVFNDAYQASILRPPFAR